MTKYPKKITVAWINEQLKQGQFPNMYPDKKFLKEHYSIVEPYRTEIKMYKGNCYKELNTYFKTGKVLMQGGCHKNELDQVAKNAGKTGLSPEETVELVAHRLEELYDKVKPLDHDIVVYRGVARGTIGQNLFSGACIKSRLYDLDMHRFCEEPDLTRTKFFDQWQGGDPREYVAETLGFTSTGTAIGSALGFATKGNKYDTVMAMRLPAGTKFIMPVDSTGYDSEYEFILFPLHNTYIINNSIEAKVGYHYNITTPIYVGSFCNKLNKYRPKGSPKLRDLRVKILNADEWWTSQKKERPLLTVSSDKCQYTNCPNYIHYCDPETGECLGDKPESQKKIQDWWRIANRKGKCKKKQVEDCVSKYEACDPSTGACLGTQDVKGTYWGYSDLVRKKVLNWADPKEITAKQKPRGGCTKEKIKQCAQKGKLCHPYPAYQDCTDYSDNSLWYVNNALSSAELKNLVPTGACTEDKVKTCSYWGDQFCDPKTGNCKNMSKDNEAVWNKMLAGQTSAAKKEWAKKKAQEEEEKKKAIAAKKKRIITEQKPRYRCSKEKIKQCAEQGKLCHPVHKYQDCKNTVEGQLDEDLYYVNNVIDTAELSKLKGYGKCTGAKIAQCAATREFCDPKTGICLEFNSTNKAQIDAIHKELKKQQKKTTPAYAGMSVAALKAELKKRGLPISGNKATLVARLDSY